MAGRPPPAGIHTAYEISVNPVTKNHTFLHLFSLSVRGNGCGLTVLVSITPTGTASGAPAANPAFSCIPTVSQFLKFQHTVCIVCHSLILDTPVQSCFFMSLFFPMANTSVTWTFTFTWFWCYQAISPYVRDNARRGVHYQNDAEA